MYSLTYIQHFTYLATKNTKISHYYLKPKFFLPLSIFVVIPEYHEYVEHFFDNSDTSL